MHAAHAASSQALDSSLTTFVPLAVIALVFWALAKWGHAPPWALGLALLLGVVLSGTIVGPTIHQILSQLSRGYIH